MVLVIPAIDLHDGMCVRLFQGNLNQKTVYGREPFKVAEKWIEQGADMLHLVDLDGAFGTISSNREVVKTIAGFSPVPVQLGGGIRNIASAQKAFSAGVARIILGTLALDNPEEARKIVNDYPGKVLIAIDARDDKVAMEGWTKSSDLTAIEFARMVEQWGVGEVVYTDILKDGTMKGPNLVGLENLLEKTGLKIIISGGISSEEDIKAIKPLGSRVSGLIIGKALYTGQLNLAGILKVLDKKS